MAKLVQLIGVKERKHILWLSENSGIDLQELGVAPPRSDTVGEQVGQIYPFPLAIHALVRICILLKSILLFGLDSKWISTSKVKTGLMVIQSFH